MLVRKGKNFMTQIILIGHPKRQRFNPEGLVTINGYDYDPSIDEYKKKENNEDPYIHDGRFLYSFCHANMTLTENTRKLMENGEDVYFVFLARVGPGKTPVYEVDTVIKADHFETLAIKGRVNEDTLGLLTEDEKRHHLPAIKNGQFTEHNFKSMDVFTYFGHPTESFLPMKRTDDGKYIPYQLSKVLSQKVHGMLTRYHEDYRGLYPVTPWLVNESIDEGDYREVCEHIKEEILDKQSDEKYHRLTGQDLKGLAKDYRETYLKTKGKKKSSQPGQN